MYLSKLQEVTSLFFKTACKDVLILRSIKVVTSSLLQKFDVSAEEDVPQKKSIFLLSNLKISQNINFKTSPSIQA